MSKPFFSIALCLFILSGALLLGQVHAGVSGTLLLRQQLQQATQQLQGLSRFEQGQATLHQPTEAIEKLRDLTQQGELGFLYLQSNSEQNEYTLGLSGGYLSFLNFLRATIEQQIPFQLSGLEITAQPQGQPNILTKWSLQ